MSVKELDTYHKQERLKLQVELNQNKNNSIIEMYSNFGIPLRHQQCGFNTFDVNTNDKYKALKAAQDYAYNLKNNYVKGKGLIFIGPPGTGKTHLAAAICMHAVKEKYFPLFTSALDMFQVIRATYQKDSSNTEREALQQFVIPDFLVIDEVGVQFKSDAERVYLSEIVNKRYEHMKPTIVLSNLSIKELKICIGERVIDRMRAVNELVKCNWVSYRGTFHD